MSRRILTDRLVLREWATTDARDALAVYGRPEVVDWLTPPMAPVDSEDLMRSTIQRWIDAGDPSRPWPGTGLP